MERTFVKFRNYILNLQAVSCIEITEDGGMALTLMNRDLPVRLSAIEASEFERILSRYSLHTRTSGTET